MAHAKKYIVTLSDEEREQLRRLCENYRYSPRERTRAKILLLAEQGQSDVAIATQVGCHWMTVRNVRLRFCTRPEALPAVPAGPSPVKAAATLVKHTEQKRRAKRAFDGEQEAHLVALACSTPPDGASRWTLQLLHDRLIENMVVERVGKETIRQTLKKTRSSRG